MGFSLRNDIGKELLSFPGTSVLSQYQLLQDQFSPIGLPGYLYFIFNYFMHFSLFLDLMSESLICWFIPVPVQIQLPSLHNTFSYFGFSITEMRLNCSGLGILCCAKLGRVYGDGNGPGIHVKPLRALSFSLTQ